MASINIRCWITVFPFLLRWGLTFSPAWQIQLTPSRAAAMNAQFTLAARMVTQETQFDGDSSAVMLQRALELSNLASGSSSNKTAAYEATELWESLLSTTSSTSAVANAGVRALCCLLQASCLVRVGRDEEAIEAYDQAFELALTEENRLAALLGKASSLQRLMRYEQAMAEYQQSKTRKGVIGAITCAMRLGWYDEACEMTNSYASNGLPLDSEMTSLRETLLCFDSISNPRSSEPKSISYKAEGLHHWIQSGMNQEGGLGVKWLASMELSLEDMIRANISPFDDPRLILLDDKVLLHRLLTTTKSITLGTRDFWPQGFVVPGSVSSISTSINPDDWWIRKKRAGYGSYGNQILSSREALLLLISPEMTKHQEETVLIQQLVRQQLLLFDDRKFSLRIYVVYFMPSSRLHQPYQVLLSTRGLVKIAAAPFLHDENDDARVHMTNSGRETGMRQEEMIVLKQLMGQKGLSFDSMWEKIRQCVSIVMKIYDMETAALDSVDARVSNWRSSLGMACIPKVLGFDFVVDEEANPWLVEINRFPGLEPRDKQDQKVKTQILRDAWSAAKDRRMTFFRSSRQLLADASNATFSLGSLEKL